MSVAGQGVAPVGLESTGAPMVPGTGVVRGCLHKPRAEKREGPNALLKQVSFPEDDSMLVTGYMEAPNPWEYAEDVDCDQIISSYRISCEKHGHRPSGSVLKQLEALDLSSDRSSSLDLNGELLDASHCESLEEILKRVQFNCLSLENTSLDDEGAVAVFDMVEYYESASHLNISSNHNIAIRGWQACSRMIKKTQCLEQLEAKNMALNEQIMPILSRALRITTHLQVLKLENCKLSGRPIVILVGALKLNSGLRELYLADNDLGITDAMQLAALLRSNATLQLLDISNNNIQDIGAGHIADGLIEQPQPSTGTGTGLSILVLWNNHLTRNSSTHFARALSRCRSLEMLNVGHNTLSSEVLHVMKDSLQQNRSLLRLGMQSTHLSCEGAIALAEVIEDNRVIQRIDLRDNNILVAGLMALALSMKANQSVTQLDLDDLPKRRLSPEVSFEEYRKLVSEIRGYCVRNEQLPQPDTEEEDEDISEVSDSERSERRVRLSSINSRKISLTCQTLLRSVAQDNGGLTAGGLLAEPKRTGGRLRSPAPSPVPSPVSSPMPSPAPSPGPARSRFRVSQVSESDSLSPSPSASPSSSPTCFFPTSRFKVTVIEPPTTIVVSNAVPTGFSCNQEGNNGSGKGSVTPDTDNEVRSIMSGMQSSKSRNPSSQTDQVLQNSQPQQRSPNQSPHQVQHPPLNQQLQQPPQPQPQPQQPQPQPQQSPQPSRSRKISWVQMGISSVTSVASSSDDKGPSSLERLLGLFQNRTTSLFNKSASPQPTPVTQSPQKRSPQSSPQQQRNALPVRPQPPENGTGSPKKCNSIPLLHPDIISSHPCSSDHRGLGNGSSAYRPTEIASSGRSGDCDGGDCDVRNRRDFLNNNQDSSVVDVEHTKETASAEGLATLSHSQKDENLNIRKSEMSADASCGRGDDTTVTTHSTAEPVSGPSSTPSAPPSSAPSSTSSLAPSVDSSATVGASAPATASRGEMVDGTTSFIVPSGESGSES